MTPADKIKQLRKDMRTWWLRDNHKHYGVPKLDKQGNTVSYIVAFDNDRAVDIDFKVTDLPADTLLKALEHACKTLSEMSEQKYDGGCEGYFGTLAHEALAEIGRLLEGER